MNQWVEAIQALGFPAAMALGFLICFYKLGILLIGFLSRIHESHEKERSAWYAGLNKTVESAMQYQRLEHVELMGVLKMIKEK